MATTDERWRPVGVRLTCAALDELDAIAAASGFSRGELVRVAVGTFLERRRSSRAEEGRGAAA